MIHQRFSQVYQLNTSNYDLQQWLDTLWQVIVSLESKENIPQIRTTTYTSQTTG